MQNRAFSYGHIEGMIEGALAQEKESSITGKRVTPYLLDKIKN